MARSAAVKSKGASQGQLRLEQARAAAEVRRERPAPPPAPPAPRPEPALRSTYTEEPATPFGGWLLKQKGNRSEAIDALAKAALADPRFPKAGTPDQVREHVGAKGADPDIFEAIDDAEAAWLRA